jgi:DNA-binding LacI/PurR family transcriptional regulator
MMVELGAKSARDERYIVTEGLGLKNCHNGSPIYQGVKDLIRARIESGDLRVGARISSEHQLARELNVSRNQARQALRELALEGYLVRKQGSGSFVAPATGGVPNVNVADSPGTVAVVLPRYISRYCRQVVDEFLQRMGADGRPTIAYNIERPDRDRELRTLRTVADSGVAGLALWIEHDTEQTRAFLAQLSGRRLPVILIDRNLDGTGLDFVGSCHEEMGYQLTKALIDRGHRRIGFAGVVREDTPSSVDNRIKGYRRALEEASIELDPRLLLNKEALNEHPGTLVATTMGLQDHPTAFACLIDRIARVMHTELVALGYSVPEHVELAAIDDGSPTEGGHVPMITIAQQARKIGAESAEVLLARIATPGAPVQWRVIEPGPLKVGGNGVDKLPGDAEEVLAG